MKPFNKFPLVFAISVAAGTAIATSPAHAQCNTCPTPVVAFSPVVAPATTVTTFQPVNTGWYPGRMFDTWRMRRWGYTNPVAVTTTAAPTWTTAMPVTAAMPVTTMMPVTSTAVVQTANFAPIATTAFSGPTITSFAPLGQQQVLMRPVIVQQPVVTAMPVISSGCSTCSACEVAAPCSSCAASTVVEQASFAAPAPCASCAQGSSITYSTPASAAPMGETSQPALTPQEAAPLRSNYPDVTPPANSTQQQDPGPADENKASESSSYFEAPALFIPGDRTAQQETLKAANRAPSVDVWQAVYRGPAGGELSNTSHKVESRSQAEIDADGWSSVPAN